MFGSESAGARATATLVTIATEKFAYGIDVQNFRYAVIIDPQSIDLMKQEEGRVNRKKTPLFRAQVLLYMFKNTLKLARDMVDNTQKEKVQTQKSKKSQRKAGAGLDIGLARVLIAKCPVAEIDRLYDNPPTDPSCSVLCTTCYPSTPPASAPLLSIIPLSCDCSGCQPEMDNSEGGNGEGKTRKSPLPLNIRVTKVMRAHGVKVFREFREKLFDEADDTDPQISMTPASMFLPETVITALLDSFPGVLSKAKLGELLPLDDPDPDKITKASCHELLAPFIGSNKVLNKEAKRLFCLLWDLHGEFDDMREVKREEERIKRRLKKESLPEEDQNMDEGVVDEISSSSEDEPMAETSSSGIKWRINPSNRTVSIVESTK
ncbi:hypothetical protein BDN72DRAFT_893679 [Pluteus cervinus]|uniref:Uncharacterized protein n=1 Tax=Pluteus cervinus TaxID=181527 RepID=A0ACD3B797_9AGAR|nr:hypothetical protein BDN72DRAFT_893679 [Pluteus cervinus]